MTWPKTPDGGLLGDGRLACATDRPETIDALARAVRDRVAQGHALYPQGGRTALDHGGTPRAPGVILDTRALNRIIDYPAADMTVTIEAGLTLSALQSALAAENQRLLIDAPEADRATLGGIFATNTTGPRRFGAGRPRDQILGVSFVTSDGALVKGGGRVVKNVAGYDFPRLLTGSMGTLGAIVQLTLKVRPRPEASALVWATVPDLDALAPVLERMNTSETRPIALEVLNPTAAGVVGGPLGLAGDAWVLAVGFEDNAPAVAWQIDRLAQELGRTDAEVREGTDAEPLWNALIEFQAARLGPVAVVANVRPSLVPAIVQDLDPRRWAVQAHAGNGIVRAHRLASDHTNSINVDSEDMSGPPGRALVDEIDGVRARAVAAGGNLTLSRCPTAWKGSLKVWGAPRPDWALAARIKAAFDPRGVMNPGRFVGTI